MYSTSYKGSLKNTKVNSNSMSKNIHVPNPVRNIQGEVVCASIPVYDVKWVWRYQRGNTNP